MTALELEFPFSRELREQHDALRAAARWLQAELEQERAGGRAARGDARDSLRVFREQLVQHFRFEERNGFEGGVGSHDPEIQRWTLELVRQHHALEERLDALLSRPEESGSEPGITAPWLTELRAFFAALRRHDAEENALLLWISRGPTDFGRDLEGP